MFSHVSSAVGINRNSRCVLSASGKHLRHWWRGPPLHTHPSMFVVNRTKAVYFHVLVPRNKIQCGCGWCCHCFSHPHSCGQLLGHGGPSVSNYRPRTRFFHDSQVLYWGFIALYSHTCECKLYHAITICPLCTLSAAQTVLFFSLSLSEAAFIHRARLHDFAVITCVIVIEHGSFDGPDQQLKWWLYTMSAHKETARKFTFCSKKAFLWFFHFKVWYHTNMPGRDYAPPPPNMLLSSLRMECIHNNLHMSHFCLCGFHLAINWR